MKKVSFFHYLSQRKCVCRIIAAVVSVTLIFVSGISRHMEFSSGSKFIVNLASEYDTSNGTNQEGKNSLEQNIDQHAEIQETFQPLKLKATAKPILIADKKQHVVILGMGPTALGAAHRLYELGIMRTNTQIVILEQHDIPGGLAVSQRDGNDFLWDMGGHVVFSHYKYFDKLLDDAVLHWNKRRRAAYAFMKGSSGERNFVPYPVQGNIHTMDEKEQQSCLEGLQEIVDHPITKSPANFDDWLLKNFGEALCEKNQTFKHSGWGPNMFFRFPRYGGTGRIWKAVSLQLPQGWLHFKHKVTEIDIEKRQLKVVVDNNDTNKYTLAYDILISTVPLDNLVNMDKSGNSTLVKNRALANKLVYSHTHIIGIGLKGQSPKHLADKSWMYFPDDDSPFYRVTVFSNYSDDHLPIAGEYWSLMCEAAEPRNNNKPSYWTEDNIIKETVRGLVEYGFISEDQVASKYHRRHDHGYPVPSLKRESILGSLQPWLESHKIYSRGRFGGWRYEVSNQDHSLMQGVEVADLIVRGIPEETYPNPNLVNSMKSSDRSIESSNPLTPDYEFVIAHYNEDLGWLLDVADHTHIYHKGKLVIPDYRFRQWEILPNVGRESHTYLYHIITNYDCLANITVFSQGNLHECCCYEYIQTYVYDARLHDYSTTRHQSIDSWERVPHVNKWKEDLVSGVMRESNFTLGEFWDDAFDTPHPLTTEWSPAGCFGITRDIIRKQPITHYTRLISYIDDHPNPEEGHYFERLWHGIFYLK